MPSMKKRPFILWVVGLSLVLSPFYYYFDEGIRGQIHLLNFWKVISSIPAVKLIAMILGPIAGFMVLRVRAYSWYGILAFCAYTVTANIYLSLKYNVPLTKMLFFIATGIFCTLFCTQGNQEPLF